ncbi:MAG: hypothetical protein ACAI25_12010 [Planctomycetota bacterium]
MATPRVLTEGQRAFLFSLAHAVVPETRAFTPERRARFFEIIETTLATRPKKMIRLLGIFLRVMRWLPLVRFGGRLDSLEGEAQKKALRWFEDHSSPLVRSGFWGVKTLLFMGYYAQPDIAASLDYAPSKLEGNKKLHA